MEYIKGNIIRPLLSTDREEIEQYCRKQAFPQGPTVPT